MEDLTLWHLSERRKSAGLQVEQYLRSLMPCDKNKDYESMFCMISIFEIRENKSIHLVHRHTPRALALRI